MCLSLIHYRWKMSACCLASIVLVALELVAGPRIMVTGNATYHSSLDLFSFAPTRFAEPTLTFTDPNKVLTDVFTLDGLTLSLQLSRELPPTRLPHFQLVTVQRPATGISVDSLSLVPENRLYPSLAEPLWRNLPTISFAMSPDTDADTVPDSDDAFPTDPNETVDTDGDLTGNNADQDDDNDLVPDEYELANGLNALLPDSDGDLDGDEQSNLHEYITGTIANDSNSLFDLTPLPAPRTFRFRAVAGRTYTLMGSGNLTKFQPFGSPVDVTSTGPRTITVPEPSDRSFWMIQVKLTTP